MQPLKIVRLEFNSPLHIHHERADYASTHERVHSDTLYAAFVQALSMIGEELPNDAEGQPPFAISSLFPFTKTKEGQFIYFLPKPFKNFDQTEVNRTFKGKMKVLKKIEWLDLNYFKRQIQTLNGATPQYADIQYDAYLSQTQFDKFISTQIDPHATIPRESGKDANPFYVERLFFKQGSGLYFIFSGDNFTPVQKALDLLEDEGIGTDRNLGNGKFECHILNEDETITFSELFEGVSEFVSNLSLFNPESSEQLKTMIDNDIAAFETVKRGGWITTLPYHTLHRQPLLMFSEGNIFKTPNEGMNISGATANVKPRSPYNGHAIWRTGKSLFVPIKMKI